MMVDNFVQNREKQLFLGNGMRYEPQLHLALLAQLHEELQNLLKLLLAVVLLGEDDLVLALVH
jgi:hypothetical protein